jgi:glycogen synthase
MPSRFEGQGMVLVEAMAAGVVPVASDLPGTREIVAHGANGCLARPGDVAGYAEAIAGLAARRDALEVMSRAAYDTARTRFDPAARVRAYETLFERWETRPSARRVSRRPRGGSRLDRRWIPNWATRSIRLARARLSGA